MIGEVIANTGVVPRDVSANAGYYSATPWPNCRPWAQTRSSHLKRPSTAHDRNPRPGDASLGDCRLGTGCAASCRPSETGSVTG